MRNSFLKGLTDELKRIDHLNAGWAVYAGLLSEIAETEDIFVAQFYAKRLRRIADYWAKNHRMDDGGPIPFVRDLLAEAAVIESDPEGHCGKISPDVRKELELLRQEYIGLAIQKNIDMPERILAQYPRDRFTIDYQMRSRANKGIWFSRANRVGTEDYSLSDRYGVLLRRQDRSSVTAHELDLVRVGLDELLSVFESLPDLLRALNVTIIYTASRGIYRSPNAIGAYNSIYSTVAVREFGEQKAAHETFKIPSMGHEILGHLLDTASTPCQVELEKIIGPRVPIFRQNYCVSLLDAYNQLNDSLIFEALRTMIGYEPLYTNNPRFYRPSEVYARLVEQYVATQLAKNGSPHPVSVYDLSDYFSARGYWREDQWNKLYGEVGQQLDACKGMALISNNIIPFGIEAKMKRKMVFPWLDKTGHAVQHTWSRKPMDIRLQQGNPSLFACLSNQP
jgi:hypothetical protein